MSNQKSILTALGIFIIISFSYLAVYETKQHQIKNSWFLYFNNISDKSPHFTIENYSNNSEFTWEAFSGDQSLKKETIEVLNKNKKSVIIDQPLDGQNIKIIVSHSKENKEIYKNFE